MAAVFITAKTWKQPSVLAWWNGEMNRGCGIIYSGEKGTAVKFIKGWIKNTMNIRKKKQVTKEYTVIQKYNVCKQVAIVYLEMHTEVAFENRKKSMRLLYTKFQKEKKRFQVVAPSAFRDFSDLVIYNFSMSSQVLT